MSGPKPAYDRLLARAVRSESGCLEWTGSTRKGYSRVWVGSRRDGGNVLGHRLVMERALGHAIPDGLVVRHKCDNRRCIEVSHLELGTHQDNMRDSVERGRSNFGSRNGYSRLTESQIPQIREWVARGVHKTEVARRLGVDRMTIHRVVTHQTWRHVA